MPERHLTTEEFRAEIARRLGRPVSRDRIAHDIRNGTIRAVRTGRRGRWYVPAAELESYLHPNREEKSA